MKRPTLDRADLMAAIVMLERQAELDAASTHPYQTERGGRLRRVATWLFDEAQRSTPRGELRPQARHAALLAELDRLLNDAATRHSAGEQRFLAGLAATIRRGMHPTAAQIGKYETMRKLSDPRKDH